MGWADGNGIFNKVAKKAAVHIPDDAARTEVLTALIEVLQDEDWDTEDESLALFLGDPAAVEAFRRCDIEVQDWMREERAGMDDEDEDDDDDR